MAQCAWQMDRCGKAEHPGEEQHLSPATISTHFLFKEKRDALDSEQIFKRRAYMPYAKSK